MRPISYYQFNWGERERRLQERQWVVRHFAGMGEPADRKSFHVAVRRSARSNCSDLDQQSDAIGFRSQCPWDSSFRMTAELKLQ